MEFILVLLKSNETDDQIYDWMIAMDNQRKERDRLRLEFSKDDRATTGLNSSVAPNFNSTYQSNSVMVDGVSHSPVGASSQQVSPRREATPGGHDRSQMPYDRVPRQSGYSPNTNNMSDGDRHGKDQSPVRPRNISKPKRKWWKKFFRWCGRNDSGSY